MQYGKTAMIGCHHGLLISILMEQVSRLGRAPGIGAMIGCHHGLLISILMKQVSILGREPSIGMGLAACQGQALHSSPPVSLLVHSPMLVLNVLNEGWGLEAELRRCQYI